MRADVVVTVVVVALLSGLSLGWVGRGVWDVWEVGHRVEAAPVVEAVSPVAVVAPAREMGDGGVWVVLMDADDREVVDAYQVPTRRRPRKVERAGRVYMPADVSAQVVRYRESAW